MSKLYLVPTPIGNLGDMTLRAIEVLKEVDLVLAEDTRKSGNLLKHFQISKAVHSHHKFNEHRSIDSLIQRLSGGTSMALITDAGTPGISDPNILTPFRGDLPKGSLNVIPVPGPSAVITALSVSGLPTDKFLFKGFVPHKKGREKFLREVLESKTTVVFYESPYRILKCLEQLSNLCRFKTSSGCF